MQGVITMEFMEVSYPSVRIQKKKGKIFSGGGERGEYLFEVNSSCPTVSHTDWKVKQMIYDLSVFLFAFCLGVHLLQETGYPLCFVTCYVKHH